MAINLSRVYQGGSGWTSGSISPRLPANIPPTIQNAISGLTAEQAFRQFLGNQMLNPQPQALLTPPMAQPNQADLIRAQTEAARQRAAQQAAQSFQWELNRNQQRLNSLPTGWGGISPMGGIAGAQRAALQQQQFGLQNQLNAANAAAFGLPQQVSGWVGPGFY